MPDTADESDSWGKLLDDYKVVRDPIHGDIWISEFESSLIDSAAFQRLRHIRQLGPTYLLYPSANHTRFEHCIGSMYVAQKIVEAVKRNYKNQKKVVKGLEDKLAKNNLKLFSLDNRDIVLVRIVALVHDAAHVACEHILQREGGVLKSTQWADELRMQYFFEECNIQGRIIDRLSPIVTKDVALEFVNEVKSVLGAIEGVHPKTHKLVEDSESGTPEDTAVTALPRPYIGDIVGNTICADLLDYVLRDSYFTGLKLSNEMRLISNFALIGPSKDSARMTLLLVRKGRKRDEVISGTIEFLRERYYLAERVYYHRVKTAASAMIIGAVYNYLDCLPRDEKDPKHVKKLIPLGDDTLLYQMADDRETPAPATDYRRLATKNLVSKLEKRELYKPVYMVYSRSEAKEAAAITDLIKVYSDPKERYEFQKYVEKLLGPEVSPGSIILYVTRKDLGKIARTRCLWIDGTTKALDEIAKALPLLRSNLEIMKERYEALWRLYVFMDRVLAEKYGELVAGFCKKKLVELNDVEEERFATARPVEEYDLYPLLHVPKDVRVSREQMEQFVMSAKQLRPRDDIHKPGVPIEDLEREWTKAVNSNKT